KLIAEPWDVGPGGYQVGNFPVGWAEWNGKYRDTVRRFWKGDGGTVAEFATRLSGSSDLYEQSGRRPYASINFVTCHDGFTLADLVSYNDKHNEANQEQNRDGENNNLSWNCGVEGATEDPGILALRGRQRRNLMATLLLSQGVPMILAGDEVGRSQNGNNNTYCHDSELTWHRWTFDADQKEFLEFTKKLIRIWLRQPALQRRRFFQGRPIRGSGVKDIVWLAPTGIEMSDQLWNAPHIQALGVRLEGETGEVDERGRPIVGDSLLILMDADRQPVPFVLPREGPEHVWELLVDTAQPHLPPIAFRGGSTYTLQDHSLALLRLRAAVLPPEF
ncbi:MAG TPA: glycogen debranching enzyme GlgX, partial [Planctomycetota bacterium]|nr:glycogen debranching enzyme GlgX [Planctomycetota bacterium]